MANILVYVFQRTYNVAVVSTTEKQFAERLKFWAEELGYGVTVKEMSDGSEHK